MDEYTVTFHYPNAYFAYLMDFCYPEAMVLVSPAVLEEGNYQSMNGVVGTGPYVYEEIVDGDYVRFVRNETTGESSPTMMKSLSSTSQTPLPGFRHSRTVRST